MTSISLELTLTYWIKSSRLPKMRWPRGLMDKASDFGSEDCEFESRRGRLVFIAFDGLCPPGGTVEYQINKRKIK